MTPQPEDLGGLALPLDLAQLIRIVEGSDDGVDAIKRITFAAMLAEKITETGDQLVGHFVEQARAAGCSWTQIGSALGVTKQAAHQRHGKQGMFERFTERARSTIARAKHEAIRRRHNYIGTEHILLGVVGDADALAPKVLSALGFPPGDVVAAVDAVIAPGTIEPGEFIPFTPRAKQALELGLREALAIGHNYIGTEHILLGLLHEAEGIAGKVLIARGLTLEQVRAEVVRQLTALQGTA